MRNSPIGTKHIVITSGCRLHLGSISVMQNQQIPESPYRFRSQWNRTKYIYVKVQNYTYWDVETEPQTYNTHRVFPKILLTDWGHTNLHNIWLVGVVLFAINDVAFGDVHKYSAHIWSAHTWTTDSLDAKGNWKPTRKLTLSLHLYVYSYNWNCIPLGGQTQHTAPKPKTFISVSVWCLPFKLPMHRQHMPHTLRFYSYSNTHTHTLPRLFGILRKPTVR